MLWFLYFGKRPDTFFLKPSRADSREQRNAISKLDDKKLRESARAGFKKKVSGRFPKYKNHSITVQSNGQLKLVSGDKC